MFVLALIVLTAMLGGVCYYLAHRAQKALSYLLPKLPLWVCIVVFAFLILLLLLGFVRSFLPISSGIKGVLGAISFYWMGIFLYLLLFVLLADLVLWIVSLAKLIPADRVALSRFVAGSAVLVLTASVSCYGFYHAQQIQTVSYDVTLAEHKTTDGMNIVMVSDLHLGALTSEERLEGIVEKINAQEPDLVCIVGDLFDNDYSAIKDPERANALLGGINAKYGVYACLGNHDSGETFAQMEEFMRRANICNLKDAYVTVDDRLVLVGRVDASPIGGYGNGEVKRNGDLSQILLGANPDLPVVVMDHNPAHVEEYGSEVDLILCGHTHKGQVFPGSLITGAMYTVDYGYYQKDAQSPHVIVSSGVGFWGPPMRVGSDCEVVQIRLQNS